MLISNNTKQLKTILVKPLVIDTSIHTMWSATGNTVSTRFLASIENPLYYVFN
jgi:hypothetical protein